MMVIIWMLSSPFHHLDYVKIQDAERRTSWQVCSDWLPTPAASMNQVQSRLIQHLLQNVPRPWLIQVMSPARCLSLLPDIADVQLHYRTEQERREYGTMYRTSATWVSPLDWAERLDDWGAQQWKSRVLHVLSLSAWTLGFWLLLWSVFCLCDYWTRGYRRGQMMWWGWPTAVVGTVLIWLLHI